MGRYAENGLRELGDWRDLIGNIGTVACSSHTYLRDSEGDPNALPQDIEEARTDFVEAKRQLKLIEDWLYYHPEERLKVEQLFDALEPTIAR
ncbi:MAG: hypothetical protein JW782_07695 [Candidatus Saganbacteria bacterium]|nr:hypothetical protein [Candidatus Saganbacteria bacterium]